MTTPDPATVKAVHDAGGAIGIFLCLCALLMVMKGLPRR